MIYYDIHTHRPALYPEVTAIISVDIRKPLELVSSFDNQYYSAGVHPWNIDCNDPEAIKGLFTKVCRLAYHPKVKAIGETGLDKNAIKVANDFLFQQEIFISHVRLAEEVKKPLIIHCVKAWNEILQIRQSIKPAMPWIIHGFRGKMLLAVRLLDSGLYLSFGVHYNIDSLKTTWKRHRLFLETDNKNIDIRDIYQQAANDLEVPEKELTEEIDECYQSVIAFDSRFICG